MIELDDDDKLAGSFDLKTAIDYTDISTHTAARRARNEEYDDYDENNGSSYDQDYDRRVRQAEPRERDYNDYDEDDRYENTRETARSPLDFNLDEL